MPTFRVTGSPNSYLISRPLGSTEPWTTHRGESMDFSEAEMVSNPWDSLEDVPESERSGPFGLARQFRNATWVFHRDGIEWHAMWCDLHVIVDGTDCGMTGNR
jgi:hypothetical protein